MPRVSTTEQITRDQAEKFSAWIAVQRKLLRYTQQEMSERIGLSKSYYANIETGRKVPTHRIMIKAAQELGDLSILEELFGEEMVKQLRAMPVKAERNEPSLMESFPFLQEASQFFNIDCSSKALKFIEPTPILQWWGIQMNQAVIIRRLESLQQIQDGALLCYRVHGMPPVFAFADLENPEQPMAMPLELSLRTRFNLSWRDTEEWGIDSKQAIEKVELDLASVEGRWYVVVGMLGRPLQMNHAPHYVPGLQNLSESSQRRVIEDTLHLLELEGKIENKQPVLHALNA
ncbi:helix-turn-helix domain-containing protein [Alicyclobacillus fastidiosus]|uniref:Helix-turn-helix domain-containing protein n=1 Tax=Alicyclobacillus fastidiosus TaxID=392011 RepID=A0ABY6ZGT4_9BACL|nr:helix-turn-helix domain-containing protein [Alicyclobacillus fastidiosus]WAH41808.1 helix-turn-helix domain-containing protein [Alicyclobacillus fastidiosus]WAH41815.1 helix-turn-helix domain-containing protein [Alicyclobacillus fastidiosus]GMA63506.1 hypothetical protein GCM10025859_39460 [Alicyclobacillus fastidiosus]GMA63513.1 hypothetical protein GCM10025859_39530 [Alicyclobacillus fastidiosus]